MSSTLTASFETRRDADMAVERLVQEFGIDRAAIFLTTEGDRNSAGEETDGADTGDGLHPDDDRGDAPLNGAITATVTIDNAEAAEQVRRAFDEFAASN